MDNDKKKEKENLNKNGNIPITTAFEMYLGWQGKQSGTWSPLICTVEALIPLGGAPGCSSSLPTAWRQISPLAFEVGADLKGLSSGLQEVWRQQQLQESDFTKSELAVKDLKVL